MAKTVRRFFLTFCSFIILLSSFSTPVLAQPKEWSTRCAPKINVPGIKEPYTDVASIQGFECLFYNILQVIVAIAGLVFFFMFIAGGFQYLFSQGDPKKAAAASSTLTMAFIGLIGVIISWFILSFISKFTGVDILKFVIPGGFTGTSTGSGFTGGGGTTGGHGASGSY